MISCTEFIPAYSELFTFLADTYGRGEVARLWDYLFQPDGKGIPLVNFVKEHGIRGCWEYWSGTLTEEACDCTMYLNERAGWFLIKMHRCPSKGRLLDLEKSAGIRPYPEYCLHCDHYRSAVESVGLKYLYNFTGTERASCSMLIYDPGVFDGRVIADENTQKREIRSADLEYFHPDFHSSLNMGIEYLGSRHGEKAGGTVFAAIFAARLCEAHRKHPRRRAAGAHGAPGKDLRGGTRPGRAQPAPGGKRAVRRYPLLPGRAPFAKDRAPGEPGGIRGQRKP